MMLAHILQKYVLGIILLFMVGKTSGQRFSLGPAVGIVASQLDGDGFQGYDKLGMRVGLRVEAHIQPKLDFVIELLYEQKGSRFESVELEYLDQGKNRILEFDYAEIPVIFRFYQRKLDKLFFETGASISRLIRYEFVEIGKTQGFSEFQDISKALKKQEINLLFGTGWQASEHLGLLFRTTIAMQHLYKSQFSATESSLTSDPNVNKVDHLRNYLLSLGMYYRL
jgi:hypothetical protein